MRHVSLLVFFILLIFLPIVLVKAQIKEVKYESYFNEKYGYGIYYPSEILIPQGESGSGDGQVFMSKNKANTLTVYRDFRDNIDPDVKFVIDSAYLEDIDVQNKKVKRTVTYKRLAKTFYVISGYEGSKIYYQKTIMSEGQLVTGTLLYNASEKQLYNSISEHIFKSFK